MELRWEMCQDYDRFYPMVTLCFLHSERKTTARRYTLRCTCVWHATRSDPFIPVMSMSEQSYPKCTRQMSTRSTPFAATPPFSSVRSHRLWRISYRSFLGILTRWMRCSLIIRTMTANI
uniref:Uncharacterized protein n=1 Tax=Cacopsylla melanoneura TaxID=428564 RepID=A0A8D8R7D2_9HEMI